MVIQYYKKGDYIVVYDPQIRFAIAALTRTGALNDLQVSALECLGNVFEEVPKPHSV